MFGFLFEVILLEGDAAWLFWVLLSLGARRGADGVPSCDLEMLGCWKLIFLAIILIPCIFPFWFFFFSQIFLGIIYSTTLSLFVSHSLRLVIYIYIYIYSRRWRTEVFTWSWWARAQHANFEIWDRRCDAALENWNLKSHMALKTQFNEPVGIRFFNVTLKIVAN